jgi:hypothetical protein
VTKQLNLFPVKGGLSTQFSPKQIMTGKVVHYKFAPFLLTNTVRFLKRGLCGIVSQHGHRVPLQSDPVVMPRGHKIYTLHTASVVVRQDWKASPMPQSVIDRLNAKGARPTNLPSLQGLSW